MLFSRKLEHIKGNPQVSLSITDPVAVGGRTDRATIQGDARVIEDDPHGGWERLLPIWEAKEPAIVAFLKARVALPLFFERALIEITPRRVLLLVRRATPPTAPDSETLIAGDGGRADAQHRRSSTPATGLDKLATYPYQIADLGRRRRLSR